MAKKLQGNGMWESSRMMLPEHIRAYVKYTDEDKRGGPKKKPVLDDMELEDISRKIYESKANGREIKVTVWGKGEPVRGVVSRIDTYFKRITLTQYWGDTETVKMDDIVGVDE